MKDILRPVSHLNSMMKDYKNVTSWVNTFYEGKGKDLPDWPKWCFLPMAAWHSMVSNRHNSQSLPLTLATDIAKLAALGTWRYSQGIYTINSDLMAALIESPVSGSLPCEVLYHLPEWCLYVETPGLEMDGDNLHGFWIHLEFDINTKRNELRFLLDFEDYLSPQILHLGDWTITEAIDRAISEAEKQLSKRNMDISVYSHELVQSSSENINKLISIALYLCSEEPEIDDERLQNQFPTKAAPKKTKKGMQWFPAEKPKIWRVGTAIGKILRESWVENHGESTERIIKAHLRRGHWHGYWKGSKQLSKRTFFYKWLPPIIVNPGD